VAVSGVDVLHVLWSGRIGGIERQVATMLRHAAGRGGLRHGACLLDGTGVVGDALVAEGRAVRLGMPAGWDPEGLARLARLARRLRPRAVHLHTHAVAAHAVLGAALPRALTVYTEHSPRVLTRDGKFRALYRLLRARNARLVALSPAMAAAMIAQGASPGAITIVPNSVDVPLAPESTNGRPAHGTVGVVARLAPQKRVDLLLDVVDRLRRGGTPCRGLVVGGGALAGDLARRRAALGLDDAVDLAGEQDDVVPWLDRMDVFLMTSAFEPFGIAALEAMARGVPVVAMPCPGGLGELAAGGGRLLPDRSVETAAGAVAQLLASPGERSLARARGRVVVGRHGPGPVLARLEAVYAAGGLTTPAIRPGA
jgi:glycosyltransferase involved in cell wall biosynthesis